MKELSEAHEDLGYIPKSKVAKWSPLRIPPSPIPNHQHEPDAVRKPRFDRNLEAIRKVDPEAKVESDGMVLMTVKGFKYVCWPTSDVYLEDWRNRYSTGIERLCNAICARLNVVG